jgi:ABC-type polysaccharide/polyol phosphate transport system ATPase subunit
MSVAIQFEQVSRQFVLHHERSRSFQELAVNLFRRNNGSREEFWALRDASFTVDRAETVGIIGPNGAGKSTALKLISRIIEPSSGQVRVKGRVGALLELGAGFHPDLTGRENIFLNGSILGLSRAAIWRKLDEIIAFAELERFIDVPVKHYSSGMYVRLGFSIAVHTTPDILLIDEVLAVGDQVFQQKCLRRIGRLKRNGVTIILVSHNLGSIGDLCERAIWLQDGRVKTDGNSAEVVDKYLAYSNRRYYLQQLAGQASVEGNRWGTFQAEITSLRFLDATGSPCREFKTGQPFTVEICYRAHEPIKRPAFGIAIYREDSVHISGTNTSVDHFAIDAIEGDGVVYYHLDQLPLLDGHYQFTAAIYNYDSTHAYDHHHRMYAFIVRQGPDTRRLEGMIRLPARWQHSAGTPQKRGSTEPRTL